MQTRNGKYFQVNIFSSFPLVTIIFMNYDAWWCPLPMAQCCPVAPINDAQGSLLVPGAQLGCPMVSGGVRYYCPLVPGIDCCLLVSAAH